MDIQLGLFFIFASSAIITAGMLIVSRNPVRSVLCLVATFFSMAFLWMLLEAEFLSIILVLVYVGAVMVLFLFVVMMLDIDTTILRSGFTRYLPLGVCIAVLMILALVSGVNAKIFGLNEYPVLMSESNVNSMELLGTLLYTRYLYPLELAGLLLLVSIIAAISLTYRGKRSIQGPKHPMTVTKADRLKIIKGQT